MARYVVGVLERVHHLSLSSRVLKSLSSVGIDLLLGEVVCTTTGCGDCQPSKMKVMICFSLLPTQREPHPSLK